MLEVTLTEWSEKILAVGDVTHAAGEPLGYVAERLSRFVEVTPDFEQGVIFGARRKIGEAQVGELLVRVEPHMQVGPMLALIGWLTHTRIDLMPEALGAGRTHETTLRQALAAGLVIAARDLLRGEVHRDYIRRNERLMTLRGRPQFERLGQAPAAAGLPCRYLELTRDTGPNRVLAAGVAEAARLLHGSSMEGMARQVHEALAGLVTRTTADAAAITAAIEDLGHRYQSYRPALQLARMLLLGGGPIAVVGEGGISGWWIDMPSLFERAVTQGVARWADRMGYRAVAQPRHRGAILDADRALYQETRPDVEILDGDGRVLAIVDAKYKEYLRSDSARGAPARSIDPQDLYQLSFYGRSAPEARLFLVAPLEDAPQIAPRYRTLHIHDATLEVVGLDLARLPEAGALPLWARP